MIDLHSYGARLQRDASGIWVAPRSEAVSYPADGHAACLALEEHSFWFRHRNRCIVAAVLRHGPPALMFDIGGGNGYVAKGLVEAGVEVVLVEPAGAGARHARQRGLHNVVCATLESAAFRPASLPAVGLFDVVEHIRDDEGFLRALARLLVPDGLLVLTVPAYAWLWSQEDVAAGHFRRYTMGSIQAVLRRSGYRIEYASGLFRWLPLPIALLRALPFRLGLRRKSANRATQAREHGVGGGHWAAWLERLLASEVRQVQAGRSMAFGGSILVVARRGVAAPNEAEVHGGR